MSTRNSLRLAIKAKIHSWHVTELAHWLNIAESGTTSGAHRYSALDTTVSPAVRSEARSLERQNLV